MTFVFFSAVLSSYLLGEMLNIVGKLGCFLCVLGSVLLVIHAPQEQEVTSLRDMTNKLLEPGEAEQIFECLEVFAVPPEPSGFPLAGFLAYAALVLVLCAVLIFYVCPRWGRSNILIYISICSLLGAFTVSSVKGLAIAINTGEAESAAEDPPSSIHEDTTENSVFSESSNGALRTFLFVGGQEKVWISCRCQ